MIQYFGDASIAVAVLNAWKDRTLHKNGIAIPISDTEKAVEVLKHAPEKFKGKLNPIVPMPDKSEQINAFLTESTKYLGENKVIFLDYNSNGKDLSKHREGIKKACNGTASLVGVGAAFAEEAIHFVQCQTMSQIPYWGWQEPIALNHVKEGILEQYSTFVSDSLMNHKGSTKIVGYPQKSVTPSEWSFVLPEDHLSNSSTTGESPLALLLKRASEAERWEPSLLGTTHENEQQWLERLKEARSNTKGHFAVRFEEGWPVEINGRHTVSEWEGEKDYYQSMKEANAAGEEHSIGFQTYLFKEHAPIWGGAPGIALLEKCYEYLLQLILDRRARRYYQSVTRTIAERISEEWTSESKSVTERSVNLNPWLDVIKPITRLVSGTIEVTLYKGNVAFHKASDVPHSLYSEETASMEAIGDFDHADSEGFLAVLGVGARASAVAGQTQE